MAELVIAPYRLWGEGAGPREGDFLVGQDGLALEVVESRSTGRQGTYRLRCREVPPDAVGPEAVTFLLRWSQPRGGGSVATGRHR